MSKAHENIDARYYLSDDTEVDGKKWRDLKTKAMTTSYDDEFNSLTFENKQMIKWLIEAQREQDDMQPLIIRPYKMINLLDVYHLCLGCQETEQTIDWCSAGRISFIFGIIMLVCAIMSPALFYDYFASLSEDGIFHARNPDSPCEGTFRTTDPVEWEQYRNTHLDA